MFYTWININISTWIILSMNERIQRAKLLLPSVSQFDTNKFKVRSQTDLVKFYIIFKTGRGLICECPDHQNRRSDYKHIKAVLEFARRNLGYKNSPFKIMERSKLKLCKFCDSGNIKKWGMRKTKQGGRQIYRCADCDRKFTANFGFERRQPKDEIITGQSRCITPECP